MRVNP